MESQRQRLSVVEIVIVVLIAGVAATFVLPARRPDRDIDAIARQLSAYRQAMQAQRATQGSFRRGGACAVDGGRFGAPSGEWRVACTPQGDGYRAEIVDGDGALLAFAEVIVRDAPRDPAAVPPHSALAGWITAAPGTARDARRP